MLLPVLSAVAVSVNAKTGQTLVTFRILPAARRRSGDFQCYIRNTAKIQNHLNQNIPQVLENINQWGHNLSAGDLRMVAPRSGPEASFQPH
jgi:hypothetical protein